MKRTLPWAWYGDPEVFRREQERIFRGAWQYAGHAAEVAEPGDYLTRSAGLTPLVVVRGRDAELRAFVNVCRHRGFPVARGAGRRETLQCGYHAWTYDLDGNLRAAPRAEREPAFERDGLSLAPALVETWGPFVFVNPDPDGPPLAEALGDVPEQLAAGEVDVAALRFRTRSEFELEANWKIVCENFLECYHCAVAHPGFSAVLDVAPDSYRLHGSGGVLSQFGELRPDGCAPYDPRGEVGAGQFHFLWPNTGLNVFPGRPNLSIGPIVPLTPSRTGRFLDYFFAGDAGDAWIADLLAFDDEIGGQDRELVEGVQRAGGSGALAEGVLLEESEQLVAAFQQLVAEALR